VSDTPTVSVCVPVCDCERFIGATVRSVLGQTFDDFELVVLDNASRDRTLDEVARFDDPRIRVVTSGTNLGAAANFNRALAEVRGRYAKVVCADDTLYPACLEREVAVLDADVDGAIALVTCARDVVDAEGRRLVRRSFGKAGRLPGQDAIRRTVRSGTNPIGEPAAVLLRADRIAGSGGFRETDRYAIDVGLWVRLLLTGDLYVLPETLATFRVHGGSWTSGLGRAQAADYDAWAASLAGDPATGVTRGDLAISRVVSRANGVARRAFYAAARIRAGGNG
jgi:glycosyltransferase involved in cell wall biosynthesis